MENLKIPKIQVKYCSTFDSTKKGNIGPSLDAASKALGVKGCIVCPALPVNGRTVSNGHLFVNGVPLSESPMRHHPLNPMTDSDIVLWLSYQTRKKVTLGDVRDIGHSGYLVTDAVDDTDLDRIARATLMHRLVSGGSGITAVLAPLIFGKRRPLIFKERIKACGPRTLVVAGSCSPATRAQNAYAIKKGFVPVRVDGKEILSGGISIEKAVSLVQGKRKALLYASADPAEVKKVQALGRRMGLSGEAVGRRIGAFLAGVTQQLVREKSLGRLIISGGETSAYVLDRLQWRQLEVGLPVEPGVPFCFPRAEPGVLLVLKSGNFGSRDFYLSVERL
jgi:uncharacterized protein YgbK (DUF1537 family)